MAQWIRLVTFTEAGLRTVRRSPADLLALISSQVTEAGGTLTTAYATLGAFDLLSVIEARDELHMEEIERKLSSNGLYESVSVPAVPISEFLRMAQSSPVLLKAWLDGRDARRATAGKLFQDAPAKSSPTGQPRASAPRAASAKSERKPGVNTRRGRRSTGPTGLALAIGPLAAVEVVGLSLGPAETQGAFQVRLPVAEALKGGLLELAREARLPVQLELVAEKSRVALQATLLRMDEHGDGSAYDVLVEVKDLPRHLVARLDKLFKR